jgi:hypothetical protein
MGDGRAGRFALGAALAVDADRLRLRRPWLSRCCGSSHQWRRALRWRARAGSNRRDRPDVRSNNIPCSPCDPAHGRMLAEFLALGGGRRADRANHIYPTLSSSGPSAASTRPRCGAAACTGARSGRVGWPAIRLRRRSRRPSSRRSKIASPERAKPVAYGLKPRKPLRPVGSSGGPQHRQTLNGTSLGRLTAAHRRSEASPIDP